MMNILKFIAILLIMCGVVLIYDARPITKRFFSFGDQNDGTMGLKISGFVLDIIGAILFLI